MAMDERGGGKVTGITFDRLMEFGNQWHHATVKSRRNVSENDHPHPGGIPPVVNRRLINSAIAGDSDEEGCASPEPPPDVPKGYLAVYVGQELRRFIIPTSHLGHHLFKVIFEKVEEEFGFDHLGGIKIPCEIETFKYLLQCIELEKEREEHPEETPDNSGELEKEKAEHPDETSDDSGKLQTSLSTQNLGHQVKGQCSKSLIQDLCENVSPNTTQKLNSESC